MDEGAGGGERGAADAPPAVDADAVAISEALSKALDKGAEGAGIAGDVMIGDGMVKKVHAQAPGDQGFFLELEHIDLVVTEHGDEYVDAGPAELE
jgi:hypothetical protein